MKKNIDELINEYVDGNLDSSGIEDLNSLLSQNPEFVSKLKAHKIVDAHLRQMSPEKAPENITSTILSKISNVMTVELPKSYFLQALIGFFTVSLAGLFVYFFSYFSSSDKDFSSSEIALNKFQNFIADFTSKISGQLVNADLMLIISIVTLIVMLSFYFLYESNKTFKKKIHSAAR